MTRRRPPTRTIFGRSSRLPCPRCWALCSMQPRAPSGAWSRCSSRAGPRLVDFARWVEAAAPALGWDVETFLDEYLENRDRSSRLAIEADPVAGAIRNAIAMSTSKSFAGSATELLDPAQRAGLGRGEAIGCVAQERRQTGRPAASRCPGPAPGRAEGDGDPQGR